MANLKTVESFCLSAAERRSEAYITPAISRLLRCSMNVSVSSSTIGCFQQLTEAIHDTQDSRSLVHSPHDILHC